jgi:hypothetical protein
MMQHQAVAQIDTGMVRHIVSAANLHQDQVAAPQLGTLRQDIEAGVR